MTLDDRIEVCVNLGQQLKEEPLEITMAIEQAFVKNPWFTESAIRQSISNLVYYYLEKDKLNKWVHPYNLNERTAKKIGIIMAGNIPLVGFHDLLSVFVSGHISVIKMAQKDETLLPAILDLLAKMDTRTTTYFEITDKIKDIDAIIATGSDNSARYFQYYFGSYPHIIRKNRVGVAVLDGNESEEDLIALGDDVFQYFGLGCRSVSALCVPSAYDFSRLLQVWKKFVFVKENNAYHNNYDYNAAIYIMNGVPYMSNETIILVESETLVSRIASLHYQYFNSIPQLILRLKGLEEQIQVVVSNADLSPIRVTKPGMSQCPGLSDYSDGMDTLNFLSTL